MIKVIDLNFQNVEEAIASFLVSHENTHVLIETGPYSTFENLKNSLSREGLQMSDLSAVLLSHIHLDHAGAAWALAREGVPVYLHPKGADHMAAPEKLMESARRIYQDDMDRLWGRMEPIDGNLLHQVSHFEKLNFDDISFKALHTPGHAVHHIAWSFEDNVFTGDVAGVKIHGGVVVPPCPPPDINIEDWIASIELLISEDTQNLYLTHFGKVSNVEDHLIALKDCIWDWAQWIKPHFENGRKAQEIIPEFKSYVANLLISKGASKETVLKYETANPSWMSVSGLMRYWKKKLGD